MPPTSRRPRSRQPELFPRSKRAAIEIASNHRLVVITEEIDWTVLEELVQAIRLSKDVDLRSTRRESPFVLDGPRYDLSSI